MKLFAAVLCLSVLVGCSHTNSLRPNESQIQEYSSAQITLPDFSMKITGYYQAQKLNIPKDFDTGHFFDLLEKSYPDQSRVKHIKERYKVLARSLDGNLYSVMLCDPDTNWKIMEDINCHLDRVEISSWQKNSGGPCTFEDNWKPYCE